MTETCFWGEAVAAHLADQSIMLPEPLWQAAGIEQGKRTLVEPWIDDVAEVSALAERYMKAINDKRGILDPDEAAKLGIVYQNDGELERVSSGFLLTRSSASSRTGSPRITKSG